jgi:hypothetical protein
MQRFAAEATMILVGEGDNELLELNDRKEWLLPQTEDGVHVGRYRIAARPLPDWKRCGPGEEIICSLPAQPSDYSSTTRGSTGASALAIGTSGVTKAAHYL